MAPPSTTNHPPATHVAHRTDAPTWALHTALAWAAWVVAISWWHVTGWALQLRPRHALAVVPAVLLLLILALASGRIR